MSLVRLGRYQSQLFEGTWKLGDWHIIKKIDVLFYGGASLALVPEKLYVVWALSLVHISLSNWFAEIRAFFFELLLRFVPAEVQLWDTISIATNCEKVFISSFVGTETPN